MSTKLAPTAIFLALAACSSSDPGTGSPGGGTSGQGGGSGGGSASAGGAGGGTVDPCPVGSHAADAGCVSAFTGWTTGSSFEAGRDHHVTFSGAVDGGEVLYVAGGVTSFSILSRIDAARVQTDGSLGTFAQQGDLPVAAGGQGCAQVDANTVVLAGGLDGTGNGVTSTYVGKISPVDGSVTFTAGPPISEKKYHATVSAHGGYVYTVGGLLQTIVGGAPQQSVSKTIERATFDGTTLGAWEKLDDLPLTLTHHAAVVYGDALYLIGGASSVAARTQVMRATFGSDGRLSAFTDVGALPSGRATSAAFVFNRSVYVVAGSSSAAGPAVDTFYRAPFNGDGTVGTFETLTAVPSPREHAHHVPVVRNFFYSAGGRAASTGMQSSVFIGKLE